MIQPEIQTIFTRLYLFFVLFIAGSQSPSPEAESLRKSRSRSPPEHSVRGTPHSTKSHSKSASPKMSGRGASAESEIGGEKRKRQNLSDSSSGSEAEGKTPKKKTSDSKPMFPRRLGMSPVVKMSQTRRVSQL